MNGDCDVPVPGPLSFAWSGFQKVTIFQQKSIYHQTQGFHAIYESQLYASAKRNEFMQRLVRSSYDIFRVSQVCNDPSDLLRLSHQYRATMAMCYQELFEFLESCRDVSNERLVALTAEGEQVKTHELLWHLSEIVILQTLDADKLSFSLVNWYFVQSQEAINIARNLLEAADRHIKPDDEFDSVFWPTALALVTQARSMELSALLASHPKANSVLYKDIRQLLITMPIGDPKLLSSDAPWAQSGASIDKAWHYWQCSCATRLAEELRNQTPSTGTTDADYLVIILSILAGKQQCWHDQRVYEACGTWYFQFVGWLFYTHRFVQASSLTTMLEQFKAIFNRNGFQHDDEASLESIVDKIIGDIMAGDLLSVVYTMSEKFTNWWIVAHFTGLVKRLLPDYFSSCESSTVPSRQLSVKSEDNPSASRSLSHTATIPDFFLLRYAESLSAEPSLLSIALGYLDHCKTIQPMARELQANLLRHTKPSTTQSVNNLIRLARKHHLPEVASEICRIKVRSAMTISDDFVPSEVSSNDRVEGSRSSRCLPPPPHEVLHISRTCSAIGWAIIARDTNLITQIATSTLLSATFSKMPDVPWQAVKEVASLITCLFGGRTRSWLAPFASSPELAILARYVDLQSMLDSEESCFDTDRLVHTLLDIFSTSDSGSGFHLPLRFRLHLLSQVKPYLNPAALPRVQTEALVVIITEVKALLRLLRKAGGQVEEDTVTLLIGWSALLSQARAAAILRCGRVDAGEHNEVEERGDAGGFGPLLTSQQDPNDYTASEL